MASIDTLRNEKPQGSEFFLSIYRPNILLSTRVNDSTIARGARTITIDAVTPTSVTNRTLLVGTTSGARDLGVVRIKSMDASHFYVAENGDVRWANRAYLTVLDYVYVQPIYPRIIQNPSNPEDVIFYKDYDVPYTNQNSIMGAFVCAGSHRSANIDPDLGYVDLYWTATGTYHVAGSAMTYSWSFGGAVSGTTSTALVPGYRRYTTPGEYVTKLTVAGANGSSDEAFRYVSIHSETSNPPVPRWSISKLHGARSEGGFNAEITINNSDLNYEIFAGDLVIIYSNDYFTGVKKNVELNSTQISDGIKFVGYVLKNTIQYDYQSNTVTFEIGTISEAMKKSENFVISVESKTSPTTWAELDNLNGKKAFYHYLKFHSTVLNVADFRYTGEDYAFQFFDTDKTTIFDALNSFFYKTLVGQLVSNKKSQLWAETLPEASTTPTSRTPLSFTLDKADYLGKPNISRRLYKETSVVNVGGIAYGGPTTQTSIPLLSNSPSASPSYYGKSVPFSGLALSDQNQLNSISGNLWAKNNADIERVTLKMNGPYDLDITPLISVSGTFLSIDTGMYQDISGLFSPSDVDIEIDFKNGSWLPTYSFQQVINGIAGEAEEVVQEPDVNPSISFNPSPITIPPFNFSIPLPATPTSPTTYVLFHATNFGLWWMNELDAANPQWWSMNFGLSGTKQLNFNFFDVSPNGNVYTINNYELRVGPIGGALIQKVANTDFTGTYAPFLPFLFGGMVSPFNENEYIFAAGLTRATTHLYVYNNLTNTITQKVQLAFGPDFDILYITFGNNEFTITSATGVFEDIRVQIIDSSLSTVTYQSLIKKGSSLNWHKRSGATGKVFAGIDYSNAGGRSGTWTAFGNTGSVSSIWKGIDSSPDGNYFMKFTESANPGLYRSSDGGVIWGQTPNFPTGTFSDMIVDGALVNMKNRDEWIVATSGLNPRPIYVLYTNDFGETWFDITGNIRDFLTPYPQPRILKVYR